MRSFTLQPDARSAAVLCDEFDASRFEGCTHRVYGLRRDGTPFPLEIDHSGETERRRLREFGLRPIEKRARGPALRGT